MSRRMRKIETKKKVYYLKVEETTMYGTLRHADPESKWDQGDTYEDHNPYGVRVVDMNKKFAYYDLVVNFRPKRTGVYYLLYATYNTGCSFGRDLGKIEYIGLYRGKNKKLVEENIKRIEAHYQNYRSNTVTEGAHIVSIIDDNGKEYGISAPWVGHFEELSSADYKVVEVLR